MRELAREIRTVVLGGIALLIVAGVIGALTN